MNTRRSSGLQLDTTTFEELLRTQHAISVDSTTTTTNDQSVGGIHIQGTTIVKIEKNNEKLCLDVFAMQQIFKLSSVYHVKIPCSHVKISQFLSIFQRCNDNSF